MSRSYPDTERAVAFGGISGTFADIGNPLTNNWGKYWIQNQTDASLQFTWDGNDNVNLTLAAGESLVVDDSAGVDRNNAEPPLVGIGTQFKVRQTAGAAGSGSARVNGLFST